MTEDDKCAPDGKHCDRCDGTHYNGRTGVTFITSRKPAGQRHDRGGNPPAIKIGPGTHSVCRSVKNSDLSGVGVSHVRAGVEYAGSG